MISSLPPYNVERILRKDECPKCEGKGIVDGFKYGRPIVCCETCDGYGFLRPKKESEVSNDTP